MSDPARPTLVCDHCGWTGDPAGLLSHPRLGDGVCPDCWRDGYETRPRDRMGPLVEAICGGESPPPRERKALIDWSDEEWEVADRTERARLAHERSAVLLKTSIEGARQGGFDFLREEFKVAPNRPETRR